MTARTWASSTRPRRPGTGACALRSAAGVLAPSGPSREDTPDSLLFFTLAHLRRQSSPLLLVNVEDLWLETAPQNVPGTSVERPNWRRKLRHGFEGFPSSAEVLGRLRSVAPEISLEGMR